MSQQQRDHVILLLRQKGQKPSCKWEAAICRACVYARRFEHCLNVALGFFAPEWVKFTFDSMRVAMDIFHTQKSGEFFFFSLDFV